MRATEMSLTMWTIQDNTASIRPAVSVVYRVMRTSTSRLKNKLSTSFSLSIFLNPFIVSALADFEQLGLAG